MDRSGQVFPQTKKVNLTALIWSARDYFPFCILRKHLWTVRNRVKSMPSSSVRTISLLALLAAFPPLSTDMYLPALPVLQKTWNQPLVTINLTLIAFFISYCFFMLIYGPVSDRLGPASALAIGYWFVYCGQSGLRPGRRGLGADSLPGDPGGRSGFGLDPGPGHHLGFVPG